MTNRVITELLGDYILKSDVQALEKLLLDNTTDTSYLEARTRGFTPLTLASYVGQPEVVDLLIGAGCKINPTNTVPPLYLACQQGHLQVVRRLLACGARMQAVENFKGSALIIAAHFNRADIVWELLVHGGSAYRHVLDFAGRTAEQLAGPQALGMFARYDKLRRQSFVFCCSLTFPLAILTLFCLTVWQAKLTCFRTLLLARQTKCHQQLAEIPIDLFKIIFEFIKAQDIDEELQQI